MEYVNGTEIPYFVVFDRIPPDRAVPGAICGSPVKLEGPIAAIDSAKL